MKLSASGLGQQAHEGIFFFIISIKIKKKINSCS